MGKYDYFVKLMNDYDQLEKQTLTFEEDEDGREESTDTQQEG
jgi:hypothetical protein